MEVSLVAAFVAGLVSFLSPCVLPLAPGYVSMLTGMGLESLKQGEAPRGVLAKSSLAFVVGFSVVFIAFGASASAVGQFLLSNKTVLTPLAGGLILLFGLHLLGALRRIPIAAGLVVGGLLLLGALSLRTLVVAPFKPVHLVALSVIPLAGPTLSSWLDRDLHFRGLEGAPGPAGGFLMGFAFAFGWTPCIGPILASVLAVAATRETVGQGAFLLAVYSAGLAIPFLAMAFGISRFLGVYHRFRRSLWVVEVVSGVLLLAIGGLIFVNKLTWLSSQLTVLNQFAW